MFNVYDMKSHVSFSILSEPLFQNTNSYPYACINGFIVYLSNVFEHFLPIRK